MKIAMVSGHANPLAADAGDFGTQSLHVAGLAAALVARGEAVTVYTRRDSMGTPERATARRGYVVEQVPSGPPEPVPKDELLRHMPEFARQLAVRWSRDRPDLVHAHFWLFGMASLAASRDAGVPVVQTFHALGVVRRRHERSGDTSPPGRERMEHAIGKTVARTLASSSDEAAELVRQGVPRRSVTVVPSGVDLERFHPEQARPVGDPPQILSAGRLVPRKGFDLLIQALPRIPGAELTIAGGPERSELHRDREARRLHALADGLRLRDRVRLVGRVDHADMPELLHAADVVACAPWYEPFGVVPLEAMASGVPVVATAVGGHTDTIVDQVTGLLVPPNQPAHLARAVNRVLSDQVLHDSLGVAGADRARSRYSWQRVATDTLRIYRQVVEEWGSAAVRRIAGVVR